jgi:ubiquinone/menaquinone biosynthesis C-methylase UbiE
MVTSPVNYNEISRIYDEVREGEAGLIAHFLQALPAREGLNILDIGCGTGNYTDLCQQLSQPYGHHVYGLDPSEGMLAKARLKNSFVEFKLGSAGQIPWENSFFDFEYMTDVIHHIPDLGVLFAEIRRTLRASGQVCVVTQSHRQIAVRPIARFFPGTVQVDQQRYPDIPEIVAAAEAQGLRDRGQEAWFEGASREFGPDYLELVRKKGYSMLHLISEAEYQAGLRQLEQALEHGPFTAPAAGDTLVWLTVA